VEAFRAISAVMRLRSPSPPPGPPPQAGEGDGRCRAAPPPRRPRPRRDRGRRDDARLEEPRRGGRRRGCARCQLVPPGSDAEAYEPRPGDLIRLRGAALVVRVGLGFDHWLDRLLAQHGDKKLARGRPRMSMLRSAFRSSKCRGAASRSSRAATRMASPTRTTGSTLRTPGRSPLRSSTASPRWRRARPRALPRIASAFSPSSPSVSQSGKPVSRRIRAPQSSPITMLGLPRAPLPPQHRRGGRAEGRHRAEPGAARPPRCHDAREEGAHRPHRTLFAAGGRAEPGQTNRRASRRAGAFGRQPSEASDYLALFEFNVGVLARALSADGS